MAESTLRLEPVLDDDLDPVAALLAANDLPTADLADEAVRLYVARAGDERVGVGGFEVHGDAGLLRSIVVETPRRGEGFGGDLCDALTARARQAGVETLYLLTTTAAGFFADRGYEPVPRSTAPEPIRETGEFATLCPSSATCMRKRL